MRQCECDEAVARLEWRPLVGERLFCQTCGGYIADSLDEFA